MKMRVGLTCLWIFHVKCLWVEVSMGYSVNGLKRLATMNTIKLYFRCFSKNNGFQNIINDSSQTEYLKHSFDIPMALKLLVIQLTKILKSLKYK